MEYTVNNLTAYMNRCLMHYDAGANNIANTNTHGFKKQLVLERGLHQETRADLSQGAMMETGNNTDMAIDGEGYFVVMTPQGGRYTRDGSFTVDPRGRLVNGAGLPVMDNNGNEIFPGGDPAVSENGTIFSAGIPVARLALVRPQNRQEVTPQGGSLFNFQPDFAPPESYKILGGYLENSNVDTLREMTDSINFIRNFELAQRVLKMEQNLAERCATEIANTGN